MTNHAPAVQPWYQAGIAQFGAFALLIIAGVYVYINGLEREQRIQAMHREDRLAERQLLNEFSEKLLREMRQERESREAALVRYESHRSERTVLYVKALEELTANVRQSNTAMRKKLYDIWSMVQRGCAGTLPLTGDSQ